MGDRAEAVAATLCAMIVRAMRAGLANDHSVMTELRTNIVATLRDELAGIERTARAERRPSD